MSDFSKAIFPALASFGPIMLAMGCTVPNRDGMQYSLILALPGAMMVTAALLITYRALISLTEKSTATKP